LASEETKRNFWELFPIFFTSLERFCLFQATQEQNKTFFIFKNQNKTKTFQIAPVFLKDRTKLLVVYKKFWKRTRTKAFGQKNFSTK
jgi:hypothetical protein